MKLIYVRLVLTVVMVGLIGGGYYLFRLLYEQYDHEIWIGASQEATRNPFLAAQRFLEAGGVTVITENVELDFKNLSPDDVVFLSEVDSILVSESQIDAAMDWIQRGGFMLVGAGKEVEGYDSLLTRFAIEPDYERVRLEDALLGDDEEPMSASERMREINRKIRERQEAEKQAENTESPQDNSTQPENDKQDAFNRQLFDLLNLEFEHEYYKADLGNSVGDIHLAVLDRITLKHPWLYTEDYGDDYDHPDVSLDYAMVSHINDEKGTRFIQFEYGAGMFTVLSSSELWDNDHIGLADHALFLRFFIPDGAQLYFFYNYDVPSLWVLLGRYFRELIVLGLILLGFWLWRRGIRVQRLEPVREGRRRRFAEHLYASAVFLITNKQYTPILQSLNDDIAAQMAPFYPGFAKADSMTRVAALTQRTELPKETIQAWLNYCENVTNRDELLAALKIGNEIRKKL